MASKRTVNTSSIEQQKLVDAEDDKAAEGQQRTSRQLTGRSSSDEPEGNVDWLIRRCRVVRKRGRREGEREGKPDQRQLHSVRQETPFLSTSATGRIAQGQATKGSQFQCSREAKTH